MKNILVSTMGLFVLMACGFSGAIAQKTANAEKIALIKEFLVVTEVKKGAAAISDQMLGLQAAEAQKMINSLIDEDERIPTETKAEMKRVAEESAERSAARMKEFFSKRLNLGELIEEITIPVYDKLFTEQEIRDMIAFYKSPTGKRLTEVTPQLSMELITSMMAKLTPKLQEFMKEAAESELKILKEAKPIT